MGFTPPSKEKMKRILSKLQKKHPNKSKGELFNIMLRQVRNKQ